MYILSITITVLCEHWQSTFESSIWKDTERDRTGPEMIKNVWIWVGGEIKREGEREHKRKRETGRDGGGERDRQTDRDRDTERAWENTIKQVDYMHTQTKRERMRTSFLHLSFSYLRVHILALLCNRCFAYWYSWLSPTDCNTATTGDLSYRLQWKETENHGLESKTHETARYSPNLILTWVGSVVDPSVVSL